MNRKYYKTIKNLAFGAMVLAFAFGLRGTLRAIWPAPEPEAAYTSPYKIAEAALGNELESSYPLVDQNGKPFDLAKWYDKPLLVSYIFTSCKHVCPMVTKNLSQLIEKRKDLLGRDFRMVTVGFDHGKDTPDSMREFGEKHKVNFENWRFATGSKETVKALAERLGIVYEPMLAGEWKHTIGVTIVAPGGKVFAQVFGPTYSETQIFEPLASALKIRG